MDTVTVMQKFVGFWSTFGFYYLVGYLGFVLHFVLKIPKGVRVIEWLKDNVKEIVVALISYQIVIFLWWDMGLEIVGMPRGEPSMMTCIVAYAASSIFIAVVKKVTDKLPKEDLGG